jgi:hypothetical protein
MARPKKESTVKPKKAPTVEQAQKALTKATKAHQSYYVDGKKVPSVTSIISANLGWNKNALIAWARRESLAGNDPEIIKNSAANIGTLIHFLIQQDLLNQVADVTTYSAAELIIADRAMQAYHQWKKINNPEIIAVECQMISNLKFGGTCDVICNINNAPVIIDWKSGNGIYDDHWIQGAALTRLVWEKYPDVFNWDNPLTWPEYHAININKTTGDLSTHTMRGENLYVYWTIFEHLLALEYIKRGLKS